MPTNLSHAVSISTLSTAGIAGVTFIVLGLALLTSWVDRRFATQTLEVQEEKLQQSEAYLSEAQRLSHTGSFGWRVSTGEIIWSEETFRIFQYDRTTKPTVELILQRFHPEDAALVQQTVERAAQDGKGFDFEHRLLMSDGSVKYVHVVAHALNDVSSLLER
jgi:PAS domain-containing protein